MQIDLEKLEWIKQNQHVCISPWTKAEIMAVKPNRVIAQPCCNFQPIGIYEPFSFEPIEKTKAAMIAGYLPKECKLCIQEEAKGLQSERMRYLVSYDLEQLKEFEKTRQLPFFYLGTKFGNLCNLACRSCDEYNSSLWSKVYEIEYGKEAETDLTDIPEYWEKLKQIFKSYLDSNRYERITFHPKGGETMLQPGFQRVLEWFIENNYNKKLEGIVITTNFTVLQKRMLDLLDQFNHVLFECSIDSVGDNYHYVRWPEKFASVEKNLNTLLTLLNSNHTLGYQKYNFMITITWSLNNIWHINEILDYWHNWAEKNNVPNLYIETINLYRPLHLVIDAIPDPYRSKLKEIVSLALTHSIFDNNRQSVLQTYLYHLKEALSNTALVNEDQFVSYLTKTADGDLRNNVRMKDYNKLYDLLTDEHRQVLENIYNGQ